MPNVLRLNVLRLVAPLALALACMAGLASQPRAGEAMVVVANAHAGEAARAILLDGGSAVDAAVAAQAVLGLVEPQSSGIGGGAFMLHWNRAKTEKTAYDGRETAPVGVDENLFMAGDETPMDFLDALTGGRAVGVPGVVAMLWQAHKAHGKLPWARLFQPAIRLAREGFPVSPRLNAMIARTRRLADDPGARRLYFLPSVAGGDPRPLPAGHHLANPAYGETLELIAQNGPAGFYSGVVAKAMVAAVGRARGLSLADLAAYQARERKPVCGPYRAYMVCGMGPPSSGGMTVLQILTMLERFDLSALAPGSLEAVHLISEASRLAFADRDFYMADADRVEVPVAGLLNRSYLKARSRRIDRSQALERARPGLPFEGRAKARGLSVAMPSTSHISIVDFDGNAVSMTSSVEGPFGSRIMAAGFILNNQLTDFSFAPVDDGLEVANRPGPGKRPRSSMSPSLVFDTGGALALVVGSPGGSRIIGYVAQALIAALDWKLDMASAVALPHHVNRNGDTELEKGTALEALAGKLTARGHRVSFARMTSGLNAIRLKENGLEGGTDPRREGVVVRLEERKKP